MMSEKGQLQLAFYGDDFTGSTDALESLSIAGIKTVLFLKVPDAKLLERYEDIEAIGVAGTTRSMTPEDMEMTLRPAFEALKKLNPRHVHYKVCSTFDSSPQTGSIGKAIDIGADVFKTDFTALLVAAPDLGRYCTFGNLFARIGTGTNGEIFRLDRHPSMSVHPVTPAHESDLRMHLAKQTRKQSGLFNVLDLQLPYDQAHEKVNDLVAKGNDVVLFDAVYEHQLPFIGSLIDSWGRVGKPLFSAGSSGVEKALAGHWQRNGNNKKETRWPVAGKKNPLVVVSGSCSPVTSRQIAWATSHGFAEVPIEAEVLAADKDLHSHIVSYSEKVGEQLREGRNVIIHTCLGPNDPRMKRVNDLYDRNGGRGRFQSSKDFGRILGQILRRTLEQNPVSRIVIAGGDTSGHTAGELGIESMEMIAPLVKGAPLCRVIAPGSPADGLEINFKGGQVGDEQYFDHVMNGRVK